MVRRGYYRKRRKRNAPRAEEPSFLDALVVLSRLFVRLMKRMFGGGNAAPPVPAAPPARAAWGRAAPVTPPRVPEVWRSGLVPPGVPISEEMRSGGAGDVVQGPLPYRPAARLLSTGEWAFWHPLFHAVKGKYRIFCKVRLADVIVRPKANRQEKRFFRKIGRYHVDFVLCEPETTAPLLVIELDDRSHQSQRGQARDKFKDEALRAAGMPVLRVPTQEAYDPAAVARQIGRLIPPDASR